MLINYFTNTVIFLKSVNIRIILKHTLLQSKEQYALVLFPVGVSGTFIHSVVIPCKLPMKGGGRLALWLEACFPLKMKHTDSKKIIYFMGLQVMLGLKEIQRTVNTFLSIE